MVTSAPNFPSGTLMAPYRNRLFQRQQEDGIDVIRVWTYLAPNTAVVRRSLDFASFGVTSFLAGLFQKTDVIVATSPQLLAGLSGRLLAMAKRRPWLLEIRDLWPDSIVALNMMREKHPAVRLLRSVEHMLYRSAARIVTTNDGLRARLIESGVPPEKIGVVPNSVDPVQFSPRPRPPELAEKYGLNGRFVVGYIGTQGIAHDFNSMLDAAAGAQGHECLIPACRRRRPAPGADEAGEGAQARKCALRASGPAQRGARSYRLLRRASGADEAHRHAQRHDAVQDFRDRRDGAADPDRGGRYRDRTGDQPSARASPSNPKTPPP